MQSAKTKYFTRLDNLRNNSNFGQLLYAAEMLLEHSSLIGWETDLKRSHIEKLRDSIKGTRLKKWVYQIK